MRTNFVLIDFESVQPEALDTLRQEHCKVIVFVGASQAKVPFAVASALQRMGSKAEYVKITGNGPNALDFHIAFYIGQLAAAEPTAYFHIISKDTGFDPLIQHLKTKKIFAARSKDISEISLVKTAHAKSPEERLQIILAKLQQPQVTKPRTIKSLSSSIASHFQKQLSEEDIAGLIAGMAASRFITIAEGKVTYALPTGG